VPVDIVSLAP